MKADSNTKTKARLLVGIAIGIVIVGNVSIFSRLPTLSDVQTRQCNSQASSDFLEAELDAREQDVLFRKSITHQPPLKGNEIQSIPYQLVETQEGSFFACNAPKTGCTGWNYFWEYVRTGTWWEGDKVKRNPGLIYGHFSKLHGTQWWHWNRTEEEMETIFHSTEKVIVGRNPYIRFLSSYKDFLHRADKNETQVSFQVFAGAVHDRLVKNQVDTSRMILGEQGLIVDHINTVSSYCRIGSVNSTVVRVEDQALWFDAFLVRHHLQTLMDNYTEKSGNIVFASALRRDSLLRDFLPQIYGRETWPSKTFESSHHRGTANQLAEYYTPAIAKIVTEIVWDDLVYFGYPLWTGNVETFRLT